MHTSNHHGTTVSSTIDGMLLVSNSWAHVLFDTSASHSFISMLFASIIGLENEPLESALSVGVPLGRDCELSFRCGSVQIDIGGRRFLANLIIMPIDRVDVILGMDWYRAVIDCAQR